MTLAEFIASRPASKVEQDCWRYERALQAILRTSPCAIARELAAAALAEDREHQDRLRAGTDVEGVPV